MSNIVNEWCANTGLAKARRAKTIEDRTACERSIAVHVIRLHSAVQGVRLPSPMQCGVDGALIWRLKPSYLLALCTGSVCGTRRILNCSLFTTACTMAENL